MLRYGPRHTVIAGVGCRCQVSNGRMPSWSFRSLARRGIERLPFSLLYEVFYQSGRALGVKSYEVAGDGGTFIGPFNDQSITKQYLRNRTVSPVIVKLFNAFFESRGGGTFYDLGANIGMVSVPVAQNARVSCVCFEPDPGNFALLRANVLLNCARKCRNHQRRGRAGAWTIAIRKKRLQLRRSSSVGGRIPDRGSRAVGRLHAQAMPLAVKIDCQGVEPSIINGGMKTLGKADLIVCGFWPWGMRRMGLSPEPILDFVSGDFPFAQVLRHDQPAGAPLRPEDAIGMLRKLIEDGGKYAQADLVLTRK